VAAAAAQRWRQQQRSGSGSGSSSAATADGGGSSGGRSVWMMMWKLLDFSKPNQERRIDKKANYFLFSTQKSSLLRKL
jgi:hypothetical protein